MVKFEQEHRKWLELHLEQRTGERKRRLKDGHAHGEKEMLKHIWFPAFGHFRYLHPEYEVRDFLEGRRFIDFAYLRPPIRIAFEVDGYGTHQKNVSRRQFCDERIRHMHLTNDGWIVARIGYDDIVERPRVWQQLLQQLIGRLFGSGDDPNGGIYSQDKEIVKLALRLERPIKLADVQQFCRCGYRTSIKLMRELEEAGLFLPSGGGNKRAHAWKLHENNPNFPSLF